MCGQDAKQSETASPQRSRDEQYSSKMVNRIRREGEELRFIPAGTVVHVGGMPFRLDSRVVVSGQRENFTLAAANVVTDQAFPPVDAL